ncbi:MULTISPECIES: glycoside hydrolase family 99-like domain-containing protein [Roseomonadaceae]|uniref:Glycoside hydrolase family 99-like domain-containing protein n=1 Tax=Falsiroseomonas oleicola TaxID=2801474 RepID=A0ABS6HAY9_9PROT|nr:glycoside hydrolase family 99-like domain-containing protein [Roseomonas oleicola]MBU8545897.1 glycoside hydrolase family 99-like domain-containing protein [Roseomonas oleicola]
MEGDQDPAQDPRARAREVLASSGIVDAVWYVAQNADVAHGGQDPLSHFLETGWEQGRAPCFYLDPAWYLATHADVREAGADPVLHYVFHGDSEGRRPGPHFDPAWYRGRYGLGGEENALAHFLRHREYGASPIPEFDAEFYLSTYRDVARAGADAFEHYVTLGWQEEREPGPDFDSHYYLQRHMGGRMTEPPLLHWLRQRHEPGVHPRMPQETPTIPREVRRNTRPAEEFEEVQPLPDGFRPRAKVLAYYLPQFHAIAENDAWWGKGFTEWANLPRALPRFAGHYQPRVPRDLGNYSLDDMRVMRRQIEMARRGGVHGWIFYWYSFNGHRLLEKPVDAFLADRSLDMPFALMWANENWTRRWDGAEHDILMGQDYRPEDEPELVATLARHFADPRYIRVQGRPVLMVYRAGLIPEPKEIVDGWRKRFRDAHGEDPVFVMTQSFDDIDPTEFGFDGAIEFPPHKLAKRCTPISASLDYLDPDFTGTVFAYEDVIRVSLEEPKPDFPLIKCAVPGWDNDPRKQGQNTVIIHGAKPATYEAWLSELIERAGRTPFFGEPMVCVNAWNEWCEGAYLEPDLHYGGAFLNATARAVVGSRASDAPGLLIAAADAEDSEAARRLLDAAGALRRSSGLRVEVLLLAGGPLEEEFGRIGRLTFATTPEAAEAALSDAASDGLRQALMTTAAAVRLAALAQARGIAATVLLQEMPAELRARDLLAGLRGALRQATKVLVPAEEVRQALLAELPALAETPVEVLEPGLPFPPALDAADVASGRAYLGLAAEDRLLLGTGPGDLRHGIDLFLQLFRRLRAEDARVKAVWVGTLDPGLRLWLGAELAAARQDGLRLIEQLHEPGPLLAAADLLVLPARESAFPVVAQQALTLGVPVLAFQGAGGAAGLAKALGGEAVPLGDMAAMAAAAQRLLAKPADAATRAVRRGAALARFDVAETLARLRGELLPGLPEISVVVPGRGRGFMLASRLDGVFRQDLPVWEVVVLDDPADPRVAEGARMAAERWQREVRVVPAPASTTLAQTSMAATSGALLWIVDPDMAPGGAFLRRAANALAAAPDAPFAAIARDGAADPAGVLWRREALGAAMTAAKPLANPKAALLDGVAMVRLSPAPGA